MPNFCHWESHGRERPLCGSNSVPGIVCGTASAKDQSNSGVGKPVPQRSAVINHVTKNRNQWPQIENPSVTFRLEAQAHVHERP